MSKGSGEEKTEKATPRHKKKARSEGAIGNTPELGAWFGILVSSFVIPGIISSVMDTVQHTMMQVGIAIRHPEPGQVMEVGRRAVVDGFMGFLPLALYIMLVSVVSVAAQGGIHVSPKAFFPKFKRLNPISGIKRLFGPHGAWNALKAFLKSAVLGVVVYMTVRQLVPTLAGAGALPIDQLIDIGSSTALRVIRVAASAGIAMAVLDYVVVKRRNNKAMKMTKQEVKEESKSSEGNPQLKGAIRSRQIQMSRNRMMAEIPHSDVVLVNPTHVAVALKYDSAKGAPRVVAKGADHLAARIREIAEENRIPMVQDIPLARTLYQTCDVGTEIPPDLYRAVATVLAFIMALKRRGSAAGTHTVRQLPIRR
jgi:flagellar biosynthetic protein FlhB